MASHYWFRSAQFKIEDSEQASTNPGCFGKSLAQWIAAHFAAMDYDTEVIAEDWGWCVMCVRGEFLLWIGCGCMSSDDTAPTAMDGLPDENTLVWHVFTVIEIPFFMLKSQLKKWCGVLDVASPMTRLDQELHAVLTANEAILFCEEP